MLGWREGAKEAPLRGAQNHGRIFLSLSFPHPVDSRQSVSQPVALWTGRRARGQSVAALGDAVIPLVAK